jgi:hypothetical protein
VEQREEREGEEEKERREERGEGREESSAERERERERSRTHITSRQIQLQTTLFHFLTTFDIFTTHPQGAGWRNDVRVAFRGILTSDRALVASVLCPHT